MENKIEVIIGCDPGLKGGIGIIINNQAIAYDVPTVRYKVTKTTKAKGRHEVTRTDYDLGKMWKILKPFSEQEVVFCIEKVGVMPNDAKNSMFNFGQGVGYWKGMAIAANFKLDEVSPRSWKSHYPEMLNTKEILDIRDSLKALRSKSKLVKDNKQKKSIKKDMDSLNRDLKKLAKDESRYLAAKLFPDIKDSFKLKKDDGKAEACLIGKWYKETHG